MSGGTNWSSIEEQDSYAQNFLNHLDASNPDLAPNECIPFAQIRNYDKIFDHNQPINVEAITGVGKCYFPCTQCKCIKTRRVINEKTMKHWLVHGHLEGEKGYHPFVI